VYFSGKITNSVLSFLESRGVSLEDFYDLVDLSFEFMRDSSAWLDAQQVEYFLEVADARFSHKFPGEDLITLIGHSSFKLRSWGVLDSVLKMMQKPQDIYLQPERFLSYFISPDVAIHSLENTGSRVKFNISISSQKYPFVSSYLISSLESLPKYVGKSMSTVEWDDNNITICWVDSDSQRELLGKESDDTFVHPQLLSSMVQSLEETQNELERKNRELLRRKEENLRLKNDLNKCSENQNTALGLTVNSNNDDLNLELIKSEVVKLNDYLTRAQQLITLLVSQGKMDKQARLAMKKVGWENILIETPIMFNKIMAEVDKKNSTKSNRSLRKSALELPSL